MGKQGAFFSMFLIKLVGVTSIRGSVGGGGITYVGQKYNEGFINLRLFFSLVCPSMRGLEQISIPAN